MIVCEEMVVDGRCDSGVLWAVGVVVGMILWMAIQ